MEVIQTERLVLRWLSTEDAEFIYELVNDPEWLRFIGDRGIRTLEAARQHILQGPIAMYGQLGFGLYRVELRESQVPIGICGLIKRDSLEDVDLGFAFLPQFRSRGYAYEAAAATLEYGRQRLGLSRIVAIVSPDNHVSMQLLQKLGLQLERKVQLASGVEEVCLFGPTLTQPSALGADKPPSL
ncbi:GNAT family N-acetyltransferase [Nodosilinea sp. LEGE 06152]|uniref:GNAT family N-acetyltransferase n=1 Tax=Nodosilinea sp. LEGE 06152 TaxID=2777966 RepID=UPI00187DF916|nr:GNAT family N-acetyltransferase [Nodosilinea sp. LEGE 06152]MBE9155968.1 GNAT family N-acetyltransferase [Nodosilinea sp. LEGE 06152]